MATEVFKLLGRISLDGSRAVEKGLKSVERAAETSAKAMRNTGRSYAESMKAAEERLERYKSRFIEANDYFQSKSGQSAKMIGALSNQEGPINRITAGLLKAGDKMEAFAKSGSAANLAIETLGKNASMKDLLDRMKLINQGIMRTQTLALGTTVIFAGMTAALIGAAKGPSVTDVLAEQEKALQDYQTAVKNRTSEIVNTWGFFAKAEYEATKPKDIISNLQSQVNALNMFNNDIAAIAPRIPATMLEELKKLGPEAAGTIHNLRGMSDQQLQKVVSLWQQRHAEAREAALSELEGMRVQTQEKIKQLQDSLTPLGIAAERFKSVWAEALTPFVESFGRAAAVLVNFTTKIGEMWGAFVQANPELSNMVSWFIYLLPAIMAILSPLAVGIGYFKGLRAVLFATQALWKPFVLGFLRVIAPAAAVTAVIVGVAYALKEMWENSESFRTAFGNAMAAVSSAVSTALAPLTFHFENLKGAFGALIMSITGGAGTAGSTFKTMGDVFGSVINWITGNLIPILQAGLTIAVTFIIGIINAVIPVIRQMAAVFAENSGTIQAVVSAAFTVIGYIIQFVMIGIVGTIQTYLQLALLAFQGVMNLINGVIQVFKGIFTGNWRMVWSGIVDILKGFGQVLIAVISATFLGRIMGIIKGFAGTAAGAIRTFGSKVGGIFTSMGSAISRVMSNIYNYITSKIQSAVSAALTSGRGLVSGLGSAFSSVLKAAGTAFNNVKTAIMTPINTVVSSVKTKVSEIKGFFTGMKLKIPKPNLPPMPHFTLEYGSKTLMGKKIEYPKGFDVDWYDKGGIFNSPSIIGVGEKRPEFVGALDDLSKIVKGAMTEVISPGAGVAGMGRLEIPLIVNGREIARAVADDIDEQLELRRVRNDRAAGRI